MNDKYDTLRSNVIVKTSVINDFPKNGISFKDITSVLNEPTLLRDITDWLIHDVIVPIQEKYEDTHGLLALGGIESRGFVLASAVASRRLLPLVLFRKDGKLPRETISIEYQKEYGIDKLCVHKDDISKHKMILIIDDILATGGTIGAANSLARYAGLIAFNAFLYDIGLADKTSLGAIESHSLIG